VALLPGMAPWIEMLPGVAVHLAAALGDATRALRVWALVSDDRRFGGLRRYGGDQYHRQAGATESEAGWSGSQWRPPGCLRATVAL